MIALAAELICSTAAAQQSLFNGCSSAGVVNSQFKFNCDLPDTMGFSVNAAAVHYMAEGAGNFSQAAMAPVNDPPYYPNTYEADINFPTNPGSLQYYFSADLDSILATQSPVNSNNQFPPSMYKYAEFIDDPSGDAYNPAGNWLDLTGSGMSYSSTRIYGYLENVSGTWPLSEGLFTYYVYGLGFVVTTETDSLFYALAYANVPVLLPTGLYKINLADSSFSQIGNISTSVSGGRLHLACDFTQFANDPEWPGWPPPNGFLVSMGATITADLSTQTFNDFTSFTFYEPMTLFENFNSNNAPALQNAQLEISEGESITPRVDYSDPDNNLPLVRNFYFDFVSFDMKSYDHIYAGSSEFETSLAWPGDGLFYYYFQFSDGLDTVTTPLDSLAIGEPQGFAYLPGDANMAGGTWPPAVIGSDVTYLVTYFRGVTINPACLLSGFYAAADVNGSCTVIGSDVTRLVNYFRGQGIIEPCADYPPLWPTPADLPGQAPSGWPNCEASPFTGK